MALSDSGRSVELHVLLGWGAECSFKCMSDGDVFDHFAVLSK